jgi:hypothetical protein
MTNLKNKVALVTGSARGIGKAIAEEDGRRDRTFGRNGDRRPSRCLQSADIDQFFPTTIERYGPRRHRRRERRH